MNFTDSGRKAEIKMAMKKVLVIDDSNTMRMTLAMVLKREGYDVVTAGDGLEALEEMKKEEKYDLIITDINMPNMNGMTFIETARKLSMYRYVPIMVLSTETSREKKEEGRKAGATCWVEKPFKSENLIRALRTINH